MKTGKLLRWNYRTTSSRKNAILYFTFFQFFHKRKNILKVLYYCLFQEFEEKLMLTCAQLQESVPDTVDHAKGAPEKIGHSVGYIIFSCF